MRAFQTILPAILVAALTSAALADMYKPGDMAVVKTDKAEVKSGQEVITRLPKGTGLKIHYVHAEGGFARVGVVVLGKLRWGYIKLEDLEPPQHKEVERKGTGFRPLDKIAVVSTAAKLMMGKEVLGRVPKGTVLSVIKVEGDWLGVRPRIEGKEVFGWLHSRDVDYHFGDDGGDKAKKDDPDDTKKDKPKDEPKDKPKDKPKDGDDDWMK